MSSSTKLLKEYIKEIVADARQKRKLWVFDFDDTLVKTDAKVNVTEANGSKFDLTPGEFAVYEKQPGQVFDYTDFQKLINPRAIKWTNRILHNVYAHHGPERIVILSARSSANPIIQFLQETGLPGIEVVALDDADPHVKATWIDARIRRDGLDEVEFLDDSHKNVAAVRELQHMHPEVRVIARHIDHTRIASLHG
jgi:hypothetical protein